MEVGMQLVSHLKQLIKSVWWYFIMAKVRTSALASHSASLVKPGNTAIRNDNMSQYPLAKHDPNNIQSVLIGVEHRRINITSQAHHRKHPLRHRQQAIQMVCCYHFMAGLSIYMSMTYFVLFGIRIGRYFSVAD